ncbi:3206_t:CDS:1, partial [Dentiscutata heterogama]
LHLNNSNMEIDFPLYSSSNPNIISKTQPSNIINNQHQEINSKE